MFSELGFWIMIAGAVLTALGFLGLAFSRIGNEMPDQLRNIESEQASPDHLPDPFPTESNKEAGAPFGRGPRRRNDVPTHLPTVAASPSCPSASIR